MRWVIIIVIALIAVIIAIFATGAVLPRKHVASVMARINQPDQVVWQTITDHVHDPEWRHDLASVKRVENPFGPTWLETYKNGMKLELGDIVDHPPRRLIREVRDTGNMFSGRWEIDIVSTGGTACTVSITEYGEV